MRMRLLVVLLVTSCRLAGGSHTAADHTARPDMKPLLAEVRELVEKY